MFRMILFKHYFSIKFSGQLQQNKMSNINENQERNTQQKQIKNASSQLLYTFYRSNNLLTQSVTKSKDQITNHKNKIQKQTIFILPNIQHINQRNERNNKLSLQHLSKTQENKIRMKSIQKQKPRLDLSHQQIHLEKKLNAITSINCDKKSFIFSHKSKNIRRNSLKKIIIVPYNKQILKQNRKKNLTKTQQKKCYTEENNSNILIESQQQFKRKDSILLKQASTKQKLDKILLKPKNVKANSLTKNEAQAKDLLSPNHDLRQKSQSLPLNLRALINMKRSLEIMNKDKSFQINEKKKKMKVEQINTSCELNLNSITIYNSFSKPFLSEIKKQIYSPNRTNKTSLRKQ